MSEDSSFGIADVKALVECAALGLQEEDSRIQLCERGRNWPANRDGFYGIRRYTDERYYQSVIWRALLSSFRLLPKIECRSQQPNCKSGPYDLVFFDSSGKKEVACVEIKLWVKPKGTEELRGINADLMHLSALPVPGVMLLLTSHGNDVAERNFRDLASGLGLQRDRLIDHSFPTADFDNKPLDFAVIGFLASDCPKPFAASA